MAEIIRKPISYKIRCANCKADIVFNLDEIKTKEISHPWWYFEPDETIEYIVCPACDRKTIVGRSSMGQRYFKAEPIYEEEKE